MREALFPASHPYHRLTIGSPKDLGDATLADVESFFRTYYVPNNATLVLVGDFDKTQAKAMVEQYFGPIPRAAAPPIFTKPMPVTLSASVRLTVEADISLPELRIGWPTPPYFAPGDAQLDVLSSVLSSGKSSRLYKRLVYDMQIAQSVDVYEDSMQLASELGIHVRLRKGHTPEEALAVIDEELDTLRKASPTSDEVERARAGILSSHVFQVERYSARANEMNSYNQYTHDPGYFQADLDRYAHLTPEDIRAAVVSYLPASGRVVAIVTPSSSAPRAGRLVSSH